MLEKRLALLFNLQMQENVPLWAFYLYKFAKIGCRALLGEWFGVSKKPYGLEFLWYRESQKHYASPRVRHRLCARICLTLRRH